MGKKDKTPAPAPAAPLKHNPFAALGGARVEPEADGAIKAEPAREPVKARAEEQPAKAQATAPEPRAKHSAEPKAKSRGRVVLRRETKHRGGKAVIIVRELGKVAGFGRDAIEALAKQLKQQLGCGGTVEGEGQNVEIVLQGDRAAQVADMLRAQGFRVDGVTS
jgi:translation initiation factor 1 (eIF-1/SUI1)